MINRSTKISLLIAVLILLVGSTALLYRAGWLWENAEQKKVRELKTQLASTLKDQKSMRPSPQLFQSLWKQVESLPKQYQQQFGESARNIFMGEMERRIDDYMKMTPPERKKELDKRIAEMEQGRKQFEKRRKEQQANSTNAVAQAGGGPGAGTPPGGPPPGGPRGGGPFGGPPGGRGGGLSGILDNTSPEFRAKMSVVMRDMEQRRKELGLPPMGPR